MRAIAWLSVLVGACGSAPVCDDPSNPPDFATQVAPLLASRCLPCHSVSVRGPNRQGAPRESNYDTYEQAAVNAQAMANRAASESQPMPPRSSGLPRLTASELSLLRQWVSCDGG